MLDTDTKRRIDTARDILVGKVPDPKSQVEQITIALIYKFMDDMDAEAEELGGKRKFFNGEFARFGWTKLMRSGLGGHDILSLYSDGISRMPENPGIPLLFRDIFKNAYLPYRDPETLKAFLKVIDEFTYDHSERLGDAFEYLLSVLGSQGDAGQFRTPRHIIDFIVAIVDPKKDETVLDPACGTAGFLISSFKHILRANTDATGHSRLTPDDRGRLAKNFKGYDISPDMVRLSLVNLYLHGFTDPHVYEYDTLTSEERWNEFADVILANPPFMSPKGGIKPHRRFSVQSKRSEVLFVDYIGEHLTPAGRAGIIVPQGVLTDKSSAFSRLRSKLINEFGLEAIITMPAGCFRPYADAETAVVVLNKQRTSSSVWFYELTNDGFSQDDRRTPISQNDIPEILRLWADRSDSPKSFKVSLTEIKERGEDLSIGEYKSDHLAIASKDLPDGWEVMKLSSLVEEVNRRAGKDHDYPVLSVTKHKGFVRSGDYFRKRVFSDDTSDYKVVERGQFAYSTIHLDEGAIGYLEDCEVGIISPMYKVFRLSVAENKVDPAFLYHILKSAPLVQKYRNFGKGSIKRRKSVSFEKFGSIALPIPPPAIQRRLVLHIRGVREIESRLETARSELAQELEGMLKLVGLAKTNDKLADNEVILFPSGEMDDLARVAEAP
jgi:type I restriction-modification system DNA methylase subunit